MIDASADEANERSTARTPHSFSFMVRPSLGYPTTHSKKGTKQHLIIVFMNMVVNRASTSTPNVSLFDRLPHRQKKAPIPFSKCVVSAEGQLRSDCSSPLF